MSFQQSGRRGKVLTHRQRQGKINIEVYFHSYFVFIALYLELQDAFNLFDQDNSGSISSSELEHVLTALNFKTTETLLRKVMKEMDSDGMLIFIA